MEKQKTGNLNTLTLKKNLNLNLKSIEEFLKYFLTIFLGVFGIFPPYLVICHKN